MPAPFRILPISQQLECIEHPLSGLRIMVYPLVLFRFEPTEGEMHFYGDIFGLQHAFETSGITDAQHQYISDALQWYAAKKHWPQMLPSAIDPRTANRKVVN